MATALSDLRTRLARRISLATVSVGLSNLLDEAINSAIYRLALMDNDLSINQLHLIGETWGSLSATASTAAQGDTSFTFSGETFLSKNVFQGDILALGSKRWLITSVTNTVLGVGAPLGAAVSDTAATIYRRTIKLPYNGRVSGLAMLGGNNEKTAQIEPFQRGAVHHPLSTGTPRFFSVAYDKSNDASFLAVYPATENLTRFMVKMTEVPTRLTADGDSLDWPESQIDGMLELARETAIRNMMNQSEVIMADGGKGRLQGLHSFKEASSTDKFRAF